MCYKRSGNNGALFLSIGIRITCLKTLPPKRTKPRGAAQSEIACAAQNEMRLRGPIAHPFLVVCRRNLFWCALWCAPVIIILGCACSSWSAGSSWATTGGNVDLSQVED